MVEESAPVAAVAPTPGSPAKQKDWYKLAFGTATDELQSNQCWTNSRKVRKTAGTQGPGQVCITNNGTLASMGGGSAGTPGSAYVPGQYSQAWWGIEIPTRSDPSHDHLFDHEHSGRPASASAKAWPSGAADFSRVT